VPVLGPEKQLPEGFCGLLLEVCRDAGIVFHRGGEGSVAHAHLGHAGVDVQDGVEGGVRSPELPEVERGVADTCRERLEGPFEHVIATLGGADARGENVAVLAPGGTCGQLLGGLSFPVCFNPTVTVTIRTVIARAPGLSEARAPL